MKTRLITLLIAFAVCNQLHAQLSVADARLAGAGATVTTKGLVTNGAELGTIRYFQDNTGGLAVYDITYAPSINRGDSIQVTGLLSDYNGLLEITSLTSMVVLNSGNPLPQPQLFTPAQLGEDEEGELVRVNDILFTNAGGVFAGNTTYAFNAGSETLNIYVRNGSPLIGQPIPGGTVDMIGILSQYSTNYQMLPRDTTDFITGPGIAITSSFSQSGMNYNGFNVNWTTNIPGSTGVLYGLTPALELGNEFDINAVTDHSYPLVDLEAGQIYYCQGYSIANGDTVYTPIRPFVTISNSSGTMTAYFNTGVDNSVATTQNAVQLYEAIDDTLIAYINRAELSLDLTIYDFNNDNVSNVSEAINAAANRGVQVRFISDGSMAPTNTGIGELSSLVNHIYSPVGDAYNIMHNKFVIIDANHSDPMKPILWSGSTNWTERQLYTDDNSVIIIQDQALARTYTLEFNEMWGSTGATPDTTQSRFGSFKQDNTPHEFIIGSKRVESYFSPSDNVNNQLIQTINTADSNAYFASMLITRYDVAQALIDKHAAGATVEGIIDNATTTTQYANLSAELGSDLHINPDPSIIMHHKYLIVDHNELSNDPLLWVGSHNWTSSANTLNDENTLVVHDANMVNQYYQEFVALIAFQPLTGCTNPTACNYNSAATIDDASCLFLASPCDDGDPNTVNDVVNSDCQCAGSLVILGCTDITACNFSAQANTNDNSCLYVGSVCDDGNAETTNDVINADCQCEGIVNALEEWKDAAELTVFPNPAGDHLNIRFASALGGMATLSVSDITGKICFSQPTSFGPGTNVKSIDLTQLPAGTYLIGLTMDSGSLQQGFVKQ
jgi:phosphatidylserine/phosphatidylglycerophosphate/cardiolipin synthase-like enzyme